MLRNMPLWAMICCLIMMIIQTLIGQILLYWEQERTGWMRCYVREWNKAIRLAIPAVRKRHITMYPAVSSTSPVSWKALITVVSISRQIVMPRSINGWSSLPIWHSVRTWKREEAIASEMRWKHFPPSRWRMKTVAGAVPDRKRNGMEVSAIRSVRCIWWRTRQKDITFWQTSPERLPLPNGWSWKVPLVMMPNSGLSTTLLRLTTGNRIR